MGVVLGFFVGVGLLVVAARAVLEVDLYWGSFLSVALAPVFAVYAVAGLGNVLLVALPCLWVFAEVRRARLREEAPPPFVLTSEEFEALCGQLVLLAESYEALVALARSGEPEEASRARREVIEGELCGVLVSAQAIPQEPFWRFMEWARRHALAWGMRAALVVGVLAVGALVQARGVGVLNVWEAVRAHGVLSLTRVVEGSAAFVIVAVVYQSVRHLLYTRLTAQPPSLGNGDATRAYLALREDAEAAARLDARRARLHAAARDAQAAGVDVDLEALLAL